MPDDSMSFNESRRKLLKSTGVAITGGALAGCSGGEGGSDGGGDGSSGDGGGSDGGGSDGDMDGGSGEGDMTPTATPTPEPSTFNATIPEYEIESTVVPHIAAIREILPQKTDGRFTAETKRFTDNPVAYKSMLTGGVDVFKGAPIMAFQGMISGSNPRVIATAVGGSDYVMVVREDVSGFEAFKNSDLQFGISSKGSISHTQPVGVFSKEGIKESEVNWVKIGGSSARTQAVAAGNIDGAALHLEQFQRLKSQGADVKKLALIKEYYPNFIVNCLAVQEPMMEQHDEFLQAYVDSVVEASKKATDDFQWFKSKMQKYFAEPLSDESARNVWELLSNTVQAWPHTKDTFGKKPYREQMKLYQAAGLLDQDVDLDTMLVREYWDNAVDNL